MIVAELRLYDPQSAKVIPIIAAVAGKQTVARDECMSPDQEIGNVDDESALGGNATQPLVLDHRRPRENHAPVNRGPHHGFWRSTDRRSHRPAGALGLATFGTRPPPRSYGQSASPLQRRIPASCRAGSPVDRVDAWGS